jgi:GH3 auxin-responsive promoter
VPDAFNDAMRAMMSLAVGPVARLSTRRMLRRVHAFAATQADLRQRYGVSAGTPIEVYGPATRARVEALAAQVPGTRVATTSGSTGEPKRLAFPPGRIPLFNRESRAAGARSFAHHRAPRADLMILASLTEDDSFTSLVLEGRARLPGYLQGLMDPGRVLRHPDLAALAERYGVAAARLWVLAVAHPGMLYSTNPSTLAVFLDELHGDWERASALVRDWVRRDPDLPLRTLGAAARRIGSRGQRARAERIAEAAAAPPLWELLPRLQGYVCWDGGYVGVFLERIRRHLPAERYAHVPMYSMSTEVVETLPVEVGGVMRFLPLSPGVLYELLPADAPDDPTLLLDAASVGEGDEVTLVVSDPWGLQRYQTEDVFRCQGSVHGVPDLRFVRRRGLTWSFTGEKLTGEQVRGALAALAERWPALAAVQTTLVPCRAAGAGLPGYRLVLTDEVPDLALDEVAERFDEALGEHNSEWRGKRSSVRLAATTAVYLPYAELAAALDPRTTSQADRARRAWESQFKLMPLTRRCWEDVAWST